MANEVHIAYPPGQNLYFVVRNISGEVLNLAELAAGAEDPFESWGTGGRDADDYDIGLTGDDGSYYTGTFPAIETTNRYIAQFFLRIGASPLDGDPYLGAEHFYWDSNDDVPITEPTYALLAIDWPLLEVTPPPEYRGSDPDMVAYSRDMAIYLHQILKNHRGALRRIMAYDTND